MKIEIENYWKYNSKSDFEFNLFMFYISARRYPLLFTEQLVIRITIISFKVTFYFTRSTLRF